MERLMGQQGQRLDVEGMDGIDKAHLQISKMLTLACRHHRWSSSRIIPSHMQRAALGNGGGSNIQAIRYHQRHRRTGNKAVQNLDPNQDEGGGGRRLGRQGSAAAAVSRGCL